MIRHSDVLNQRSTCHRGAPRARQQGREATSGPEWNERRSRIGAGLAASVALVIGRTDGRARSVAAAGLARRVMGSCVGAIDRRESSEERGPAYSELVQQCPIIHVM